MGTRKPVEPIRVSRRKPEPDAHKEQKHSPSPLTIPAVLTSPALLQPGQVLTLQRTVGNRAVTRLLGRAGSAWPTIQAKLMVGPANDAYEQEADRIADQVVSRPAAVPVSLGNSPPPLQRQEENEAMARPLAASITPLVQRHEVLEEEVQTSRQEVQDPAASFAAGDEVESRLVAQRGSGSPLPPETRAFMEPRFGADFSGVRLHTDGEAAQLSRDLQAQAFTHGRDIYMGAGKFEPGSEAGQHLLAHELTHVIQQTGAGQPASLQRRGNNIPPAATLEGQAKAGHKIIGKSTYAKLINAVRVYHQLPANNYHGQLNQLDQISGLITLWESKHGPAVQVAPGPGGKISAGNKRRNVVYSLKQAINQERDVVKSQQFQAAPLVTPAMFTAGSETNVIPEAVGGAMNKLDEITYGFGVATEGGQSRQIAGGQFTSYFKKQQAVDPLAGQHRGGEKLGTGIPINNPKFAERNLAMYEIDKLLGANVIPPTFAATHAGQAGIAMEKVNGITGQKATPELLANPLVRQSLSKLYLLDVICGQVDRHPGNFMVVIEDGVIKGAKGIDNDLSFGNKYNAEAFDAFEMMGKSMPRALSNYVLGKMPSMLDEIDQPFAEQIIQLATRPNLIQNALNGLVTQAEIDATLVRLTKLAAFLQGVLDKPNGVMKTHWD